MDANDAKSTAAWVPHPLVPGLERRTLITKQDDGLDASIYLFRAQKGVVVSAEPHRHPHSEDMTYVVFGSATLWREDIGEQKLEAGMFVRVPVGVLHKVCEVSDDFYSMNFFLPAVE